MGTGPRVPDRHGVTGGATLNENQKTLTPCENSHNSHDYDMQMVKILKYFLKKAYKLIQNRNTLILGKGWIT